MQNLEEICIVYSAENYAEAIYFKEFMKWVGISHFTYVYNEVDEELNKDLMQHNNQFDVVFGINSKSKKWEEYLDSLSKIRVDVTEGEIWNGNKLAGVCLEQAFQTVWEKIGPNNLKIREVFDELISIYCEQDILRKLMNNTYSLYMILDEQINRNDYIKRKKQLNTEYMPQYQAWLKTIKDLENLLKRYEEERAYWGREYVLYALGYSKRKVNELCELLKMKLFIDTPELLREISIIYQYDEKFYRAEGLKSKVTEIGVEYEELSIPYIKKCTLLCRTDACSSFYYYRLGKLHEKTGRVGLSIHAYQTSYNKNCLNFRSLFKLAVERINQKDEKKAEEYLKKLLNVLQLTENLNEEKLRLLPPMELEYASKCFILLGNLADEKIGNKMAPLYYEKVVEIEKSVEENIFLKKMYPNEKEYENVKLHLKTHLTKTAIKEKLRRISRV